MYIYIYNNIVYMIPVAVRRGRGRLCSLRRDLFARMEKKGGEDRGGNFRCVFFEHGNRHVYHLLTPFFSTPLIVLARCSITRTSRGRISGGSPCLTRTCMGRNFRGPLENLTVGRSAETTSRWSCSIRPGPAREDNCYCAVAGDVVSIAVHVSCIIISCVLLSSLLTCCMFLSSTRAGLHFPREINPKDLTVYMCYCWCYVCVYCVLSLLPRRILLGDIVYVCMYVCVYIYIYIYMYIYIYIYILCVYNVYTSFIYIYRERERYCNLHIYIYIYICYVCICIHLTLRDVGLGTGRVCGAVWSQARKHIQ